MTAVLLQTDHCVLSDCDEVGRVMELVEIVRLRSTMRAHRVWNATYSTPYFTYYVSVSSIWSFHALCANCMCVSRKRQHRRVMSIFITIIEFNICQLTMTILGYR